MKIIGEKLKAENFIKVILGSFILAFGVYNIHSVSSVTEGGIIGLSLLCEHWLGISPAITSYLFTLIGFGFGYRQLGKDFLIYSFVGFTSYSIFYFILEQFPRLFPKIANYPLEAAIVGAIFVGVGVGFSVSGNGAIAGDDAIAMGIRHKYNCPMFVAYGILDVSVLLLSLSYIPIGRIIYSFITVSISGVIIEGLNRILNRENDNT